MVGLGNTAVDFTVFFLLNLSGIYYLFAQVLSYLAGVINSFFFNRKWTFRMSHKTNLTEFAKFFSVNCLSLLVSSSLLYILYDKNHLDIWHAKITATGVGFAVNFIGSRIWVFAENQPITGEII
jgi:putative flippase GtrA